MASLLNLICSIVFVSFVLGLCEPKIFSFILPTPNRKKTSLLFGAIFVVLLTIAFNIPEQKNYIVVNENNSQRAVELVQINDVQSLRVAYDKIQAGMTKQDVIKIMGMPRSNTEIEISGSGKLETWHYQIGFNLTGCSIDFLNGRVNSKFWINL